MERAHDGVWLKPQNRGKQPLTLARKKLRESVRVTGLVPLETEQ